jgi:hypothetical protein
LENLLANLNILLPPLWPELMAPDRFMVGRAYAEVHANGQTKATSGLRTALLKVSGFDYVPEDLRSRAFIEAAARLQSTHFEWDNFTNEPKPMRALASLGSSIPLPAFARCMTAVLLVRVGNRYGFSWAAQDDAVRMLDSVTTERWTYFFNDCLPSDDVLLAALSETTIAARWCEIIAELERVSEATPTHKRASNLLRLSLDGQTDKVRKAADLMWQSLAN